MKSNPHIYDITTQNPSAGTKTVRNFRTHGSPKAVIEMRTLTVDVWVGPKLINAADAAYVLLAVG